MDVNSNAAILPSTLDRSAFFPSPYSSDNNFGIVKGGGGKKRRNSKKSRSRPRSFRQIRLGRTGQNKSLCLDVEGGSKRNGARFIAWPCHKGPNQKFRTISKKQLQAKHSRKCMNPRTFRQTRCK